MQPQSTDGAINVLISGGATTLKEDGTILWRALEQKNTRGRP